MVHPHICTDLANFYSNCKVNGFVCSGSMLINQVNQQDTVHVTYAYTLGQCRRKYIYIYCYLQLETVDIKYRTLNSYCEAGLARGIILMDL